MQKLNLKIIALIVTLLTSCNPELARKTEEAKIAIEASSRDVKNKILQIKKEAAEKGVNFKAFTTTETGSKVSSGGVPLREAKVQAINATEKFLKAVEEEALKLKEYGNSDQFPAMFELVLEVIDSLEEIGIKTKDSILEQTKSNPVNTAERLVEVKAQIENNLEKIKQKQNLDSEEKKPNKSKEKK
ncbi:decorin-binding protein DbpB (plasmid) [Borreliella sinica]|uniref:decorin-binding protein DbpB n=1 Tax=Borreliella sinica TaxID=87162 RepID=UPI002A23AEE1|nr:decorin-binding protein DbpB [Borreliella sinica]WPM06383.1 decorin-binding protein DbpB [Borreliella sinica]